MFLIVKSIMKSKYLEIVASIFISFMLLDIMSRRRILKDEKYSTLCTTVL